MIPMASMASLIKKSMTNLIVYYDTQKCHTIVFDFEWIILSYETFVYEMNFVSKFYNLEYHRKYSF